MFPKWYFIFFHWSNGFFFLLVHSALHVKAVFPSVSWFLMSYLPSFHCEPFPCNCMLCLTIGLGGFFFVSPWWCFSTCISQSVLKMFMSICFPEGQKHINVVIVELPFQVIPVNGYPGNCRTFHNTFLYYFSIVTKTRLKIYDKKKKEVGGGETELAVVLNCVWNINYINCSWGIPNKSKCYLILQLANGSFNWRSCLFSPHANLIQF